MTNRAIKGNGRKHRELPDDDDDEDGESYTDDSGTMPCPVGCRALDIPLRANGSQ